MTLELLAMLVAGMVTGGICGYAIGGTREVLIYKELEARRRKLRGH